MQIIQTAAQRAAVQRMLDEAGRRAEAEASDHAALHASGCATDPGPDPYPHDRFPPLAPCEDPEDRGERMLGGLLLALAAGSVALALWVVLA